MLYLHSITSRLVFFSLVAFMAVAVCVSFSYFIAVREIKTIMTTDVRSIADSVEKSLEYIASVKPDAYKDEKFKNSIYGMKLGKTGYLFMLDSQGTLVVHKTDEGKNLAGQPHIDFIRTHKEGGVLEYTAKTTGQEKMVTFRYIKPWKLWIVPGVGRNQEIVPDHLRCHRCPFGQGDGHRQYSVGDRPETTALSIVEMDGSIADEIKRLAKRTSSSTRS